MKKLISILLVAMLIIGMFPATALTAFADTETVKYTFSNYAAGTQYAKNEEHKLDDVVTVITNDCHFTTQLRIYSSSSNNGYAVIKSTKAITAFAMNAGNKKDTVVIYGSDDGATWTEVAQIATTSTSYKDYSTGTFTTAYKWLKLDVSGSNQVRIASMSLTFDAGSTEPDVPACQHANKVVIDEAADATCTEPGITAGEKCADCGEVITAQEEIPATGHNYVDGECENCGEAEPEAPAGNTTIAFEFGANGSASHSDGSSATSYSETVDGYTLSLTGGTQMYKNARDAKGNSCIKLGSSKNTGGFSFTVPNEVTSVVIRAAQYKANVSKLTVNGTTHTLSGASDNGAYDEITVDTTSTKTVTVSTASGGVRAMVNSITYVIAGSTDEPDCEHTNKVAIGEAKEASCTENGITAGEKCADCDHVITAQEPIPATKHEGTTTLVSEAVAGTCQQEGTAAIYHCSACGADIGGESTGYGDHSYVDGECELCGEAEPSEQTINFATADQRVSLDTESQVWKNGNVTFTNNKAGSTSNVADYTAPARFYKSSALIIEAPSNITKIVFNCNTAAYATDLQASIGAEATVDDKVVTVIPTEAATSYTIAALAGQVRMDSVTVSYAAEPDCQHTNKVAIGEAKDATCTETGITAGEKCADCGHVIAEQETIAKLPHNYVDGFCSVCEAAEPERYYIAAYRDSEEKYYYMTSDLGESDTKRYQAVAADILPSNIDPNEADSNYVFILIDNGDGTYSLQAEGVEGDNYLYHSGTSNSGNYASQENALKLTMTVTEDGKYNFHYAGSDEERYLSLNGSKDQNYFAWYKNTQKYDLTLIPIEEAEDQTAKLYGNVDGITVTGNLNLDLNGVAATNVTAEKIYAYDSSATVTRDAAGKIVSVKEGTGSLTTTSTVVTDNTVDGLRYIALNNNGTYTFHILDLKLSSVSLRASAAGIYYKAEMNCDATLKAATEYHGMVVSVNNMPGADFGDLDKEGNDNNCYTMIEGAPSEKNFTSCAVFGIFKVGKDNNAARGEMKIYANAYLQLKGTGEIIMADTSANDEADDAGFDGIAWSLRDVMEALNAKFSTLEADDQTNLINFFNKWQTAMTTWNVDNISDAADATPAE